MPGGGTDVCVGNFSCGGGHGGAFGFVFDQVREGLFEFITSDNFERAGGFEVGDGLAKISVGGADEGGDAEGGGFHGVGAVEIAEGAAKDDDVGECVGGGESAEGVEQEDAGGLVLLWF